MGHLTPRFVECAPLSGAPMDAIAEVEGVPKVDDFDRIIGMPEPVVLNLGITQCYHELALAMSRFLADRLHSLGASIGDDQALSVVIRELDLPGIAARAGDAVARGNLKVFEEIG